MNFRCRCRHKACEARQTIAKHPTEYVRTKRCRCCGKGELRVDRYRQRVETKRNLCHCSWYSFPHAKGRGYCEHNRALAGEARWGRGEYMGARAT